MPKYIYKCNKCTSVYEATHSLQEELTKCSSCGAESFLERLPSNFNVNQPASQPGTGNLVNTTIEETKKELAQELEERKNRVWKPQ